MTGRRAARAVASVLAVAGICTLAGCGGDGRDTPAAAPRSAASTSLPQVSVDPSEAAADAHAPPSVGEFCAPYVEMRRTVEAIDYSADDAEIAALLAPVMRGWAREVPDLRRPPGIADDVWDGLQLLARRILALPESPTLDEIKAVEDDLTRADQRLISAASDWFAANCVLEPSGHGSK